MPRTRTWLPWAMLFSAIAVVEVLVRFAAPFSLRRVLVVEAVLFLAAALAALVLIQRPSFSSGWRLRLHWTLVWAFVLGGIRAAIWAAGQPVMRANLVILLLAIVVLIGSRIRRRRRGEQPPPATSPHAAA